ncbi:RRM_1 domain-containing protein/G-patch domain-containing protein/RRM_6 domain-containing protein [Cephalotus follicularis]|uniref:RRM_1 domain-containing protein/G-patch domain-containing protein/RRM_6 domain-containing protein n=1 Tax=Cephalotus follicularis TaxID=3775 RepID=A0A1Q3B1T3_CEPFO|nr:RRM_1 domain-containing protein/G-patch domain-containing protein/RRM_6 domain-containing protein [Cephalotus follicularis]
MEPGRYALQQGWDNNSALEGYGAVHEPNFRVGGSYDERRFLDERYSRDNFYQRNAFHRDILERENYPHPLPDVGLWPQSRRRSYEEEYPLDRESRRHNFYHDMDTFRDHELDSVQEPDKFRDGYRSADNYRDHGFDRPPRSGGRDRDDYSYEDHDYRSRIPHQNRGGSHDRDYDHGWHSYDSDYDRGSRRDGNWRRRESRDRGDKRELSREKDQSPNTRHERSRSYGRDDHSRSRSPRGRSYSRSHRENSYDDDDRYERPEKRRDRDEKRNREHYSVAPSATVVVKGLSQKTTEEDLYQILAEWGPLRHVRVIKERNTGISRGFAFIDFPSVGAAHTMMDRIGDDGLVVDGRKLFFEYSSKPTGGAGGTFGPENAMRSGQFNHKGITVPSDWMCTICNCVNFARRTSCFQCNEPRTDDAPPADIALSSSTSLGKKGSEAGPTHVLVVRGLEENADEEMLRYEFSKHAPIKDLRLVRDKFTHVSRGFAFIHLHSVEDATKALEATNGTTLEKNGQILRVAYAKSILGPGSGTSGSSQSSSLAAAAIEAAAFAQQYDAVGWAPKEYNPDDKRSAGEQEGVGTPQQGGSALQSGFVWDEASGYYYDAASGFYYDGNTGLYYDGNSGTWYSYDHQTQQYIPCTDQNDIKPSNKQSEPSKASDGPINRKAVISAPAATIALGEKPTSLPDAVQAAAAAAIAAEKKEKERAKEIKLASKSSILASKKKMSNVLTMWKQRSHEGQAPRVALDESSGDDRQFGIGQSMRSKFKSDLLITKENTTSSIEVNTAAPAAHTVGLDSLVKPRPVSNSLGGTLMGVIRGSGRGVLKSDTSYSGSSTGVSTSSPSAGLFSSTNADTPTVPTPFRTDASALGSYASPMAAGSGKRRFSELPVSSASIQKEQSQTTYRDRAAERRSLYGSSSSIGDDLSEPGFGDSNRNSAFKKGSSDPTPFPPGVGGGRGISADNVQSYEVITADKAIDESNVGNRMLRSMGWQEGLGLGKDGSGMVEPVQAQPMESRAGLGSQQKKLDPSLEVQSGDSYKTLIQKKALARFREMS